MAGTNGAKAKITERDVVKVPELIEDIKALARAFANLPWPEGLTGTFMEKT